MSLPPSSVFVVNPFLPMVCMKFLKNLEIKNWTVHTHYKHVFLHIDELDVMSPQIQIQLA